MEQSAVEWLINEMHKKEQCLIETSYNHLFDQAKEMEKQQIIDAYDKSYIDRYYYNGKNGVQYYNKTFKNK